MRLRNMPMKQPSKTHTTGDGGAMTDFAGPRTARTAKGFINMSEIDFCPSCGLYYVHHHGLIRTCEELQKAKLEIVELKWELAELRDEELKFNQRETEKIQKL
jgi:hypothetical protein